MNSDRIKNSWLYKNRILILGVFIVTITHLIVMLIRNSGPLGELVYKSGDNQHQVLGLVAEIRRKIIEGESPFYTWHILGGMDFYLTFVDGLSNIYIAILCLFPYRLFNNVSDVLIVLHSIGMFLSIRYYLLNRESGKRFVKDSPEVLLFAIPYALLPEFHDLSYSAPQLIAYVLMPLVILGLERIVYNKGYKLYMISLSLLVIENTYLGFIGCIFIVLYYITLKFESIKSFLCISLKVLGISFVSVMTSAFYFVPQLIASKSGGYGFSEFKGAGFYENWLKILDEAMWGAPLILKDGELNEYWKCNLYVGILVFVLAFAFFTIKHVSVLDRGRKMIVLIILMLCINEGACNYAMHLFHYTHGHPNRHSIYLIFYLIVLAVDAFDYYSDRLKKKDKIRFGLINFFLIILLIITGVYNGREHLLSYVVSVVLVVFYFLIMIGKRQIKAAVWTRIIVSVLVAEICSNYLFVSVTGDEDRHSGGWNKRLESVVKDINDQKGYRCGLNTWYLSDNSGCTYGYNTCSGFSSSANLGYLDMLSRLGVDTQDFSVNERGYNSFLNAIYARKYLFESTDKQEGYVSKDDVPFVEREIEKKDGVIVYKNKKCISPLVVAEGDLEEFESYVKSEEKSNNNISDTNNYLCSSLTSIDDVMNEENVNFKIIKMANCHAKIDRGNLIAEFDNGGLKTNIAVVKIEFDIPKDGEYIVSDFDNYNIGYHKAGEKVEMLVDINEDAFVDNVVECQLSVNRVDTDKWEKVYKVLKKNQMDIDNFEAGYIKGSIMSSDTKTVFTTIPYDEAWEVLVDNEKVETRCIADSYLTFDINEGKHVVEMRYKTSGVELGIIISMLSLLFGIGVVCMRRDYGLKKD